MPPVSGGLDGPGEPDGEAEGLADGEAEGLADGDADGPGLPLADGEAEGDGEGAGARPIGSVLTWMNPPAVEIATASRPCCAKTSSTWSGVTVGSSNLISQTVPPV